MCVCVSEVSGMPVPVNFLQLSNFPEISFQSHITTSEEGERRSLAVGLWDGKADFQAKYGPVSGYGRKDAGVPGSRSQCGHLGYA